MYNVVKAFLCFKLSMIIYKIENKINGKCYIGQTVQPLEKRIRRHQRESGCHVIYRAIQKYGIENFIVSVLAIATSVEELNKLEIDLIKENKSLIPNGYNLTTGGKGSGSHIVTPEVREKIRKGLMGNTNNSGNKHSDKTKKQQSESRKLLLKSTDFEIPRGERIGTSVLKETQVKEIKLKLETQSTLSIAKEYGVSWSCIKSIKSGESCKHVNVL